MSSLLKKQNKKNMAENDKFTTLEQAFSLGSGQDSALNWLTKSKLKVAVFLISGIKLEGVVSGHDQYSMLLTDAHGNQQLIYKAKISTITQALPTQNTYKPHGTSSYHNGPRKNSFNNKNMNTGFNSINQHIKTENNN